MTMLVSAAMGMAALAIDVSWMRIAHTQAQDVADAAANAALIELRRTGDVELAAAAAEEFVSRNVVGDRPAELLEIEFGRWDEEDLSFQTDSLSPHAVRAVVGRPHDNPLPLYFAHALGWSTFAVEKEALAATRSMQVVLVMDVTGSFAADIGSARAAALEFLDLLDATHGEYDMVGMVLYHGRFGVEYTPLKYLDDEFLDKTARADWQKINVASKRHWLWGWSYGGTFPDMPREYPDEAGTDHHTGIEMALQMFTEKPDPYAFKAIVMLTDGRPSTLSTPQNRANDGYVETRWRAYEGPAPHSTSQIRTRSLQSARRAWEEHGINVWSVSYDAREDFLVDMAQGVGSFYYTENAQMLRSIFAEIASSLPIATVR